MRECQTKKTPLTLIIGDKELENKTISYRKHGSKDTITMETNKFIESVLETIKSRKNNL